MSHYSVATTKDQLSRLIDKALAGEEVVITRHGKPTVQLHVVAGAERPAANQKEWMERLRLVRASLPASSVSHLEMKRIEEAERPF